MKNKKNIILISGACLLVIIGVIIILIINKNRTREKFNSNIIANENVINENEINTTIENVQNEIKVNETKENSNVPEEELASNSEEANIDEIEQQKTKEEKAIEIARRDWGEDESVDFVNENKRNDGKYQVAVRKKDTRNAVCYYYINLETNDFEKEIEY